jgi:hypothetical protein
MIEFIFKIFIIFYFVVFNVIEKKNMVKLPKLMNSRT